VATILVPSTNLICNEVVGASGVKGTSARAVVSLATPLSEETSLGTSLPTTSGAGLQIHNSDD
jgi:hypothetical protein